MRIITISRQFGSGGRELGKRLADRLNWDYYDREIIETLAREHGLDEKYVRQMLGNHGWHNLQLTYRNSFSHLSFVDPGIRTQLLVRTREILQEIARAGNDCIFCRSITLSGSACAQIFSRASSAACVMSRRSRKGRDSPKSRCCATSGG